MAQPLYDYETTYKTELWQLPDAALFLSAVEKIRPHIGEGNANKMSVMFAPILSPERVKEVREICAEIGIDASRATLHTGADHKRESKQLLRGRVLRSARQAAAGQVIKSAPGVCVCLSVSLSLCLSVSLSLCLSVCLSVCCACI